MSLETYIRKAIRKNDQKEYCSLIDKIYQEFSPELLAFNLKRAPKDVVEDAIDNVFITILEDPKKIMGARSIKKYLHKMVENAIVDRLRAEREYSPLIEEEEEGVSQDLDISIQVEANAVLSLAKEMLPEGDYTILMLHLLYDCSFAEIAKRTSLGEDAVAYRYNRAIHEIQRRIHK